MLLGSGLGDGQARRQSTGVVAVYFLLDSRATLVDQT